MQMPYQLIGLDAFRHVAEQSLIKIGWQNIIGDLEHFRNSKSHHAMCAINDQFLTTPHFAYPKMAE